MKRLYLLIALAAAVVAVVAVNAGIFAYRRITAEVTVVQPLVVFDYGSNANQPDLGAGNKIAVALGPNNVSVTITIHPTYQHTYYRNVTIVKNLDSIPYYVAFRVVTPITGWPTGSTAKMIIYSSNGTEVAEVDLTQHYTTGWIGILGAGDYCRIDFYTYYPEGHPLPDNTQVEVQLIYSPQSQEAPT